MYVSGPSALYSVAGIDDYDLPIFKNKDIPVSHKANRNNDIIDIIDGVW